MSDVYPFLSLVLITLVAFGVGFYWLIGPQEETEEFSDLWVSILATFKMGVLGDTEPLGELQNIFTCIRTNPVYVIGCYSSTGDA
eukprot:UN04412